MRRWPIFVAGMFAGWMLDYLVDGNWQQAALCAGGLWAALTWSEQ